MHRSQDEDEEAVPQSRAPISSERTYERKAPGALPSCRRCPRSRGRCCCSRAAPCAAASSAPGARTRASGRKETRRRTDSRSDCRCACVVQQCTCKLRSRLLYGVQYAPGCVSLSRFTPGEPLRVSRCAVGSCRLPFEVKKQNAPTAPAPARPAAAQRWAPPAPPTPDA